MALLHYEYYNLSPNLKYFEGVILTTATIAIIGAGHMGGSLLGGLIANQYPPNNLWVAEPEVNKLSQYKSQFKVQTTSNNHEAINHADVVILAIKPQIFATVAQDIAKTIQEKKPLIISIAAGIREESIQKWLGGNLSVVRAMPNTPALIGCGATAFFANKLTSEKQSDLAESILRAVGMVVKIEDEKLMDVITPLSGSGPAYFFLVIEAMQNAAIELGLPKETARLLTLQTAYGASRMALESDVDAVELRHRVTSPGGTTERALQVLEEKMHDLFKHALAAAKIRSEELAETLGSVDNSLG